MPRKKPWMMKGSRIRFLRHILGFLGPQGSVWGPLGGTVNLTLQLPRSRILWSLIRGTCNLVESSRRVLEEASDKVCIWVRLGFARSLPGPQKYV